MTGQQLDESEVQRFAERAIGDLSAMWTVALCYVGDRLGLFRDLHENGPATASDLAARTGVDERYAAEWLRGADRPGLPHARRPDRTTRALAGARDGAGDRGRPVLPRRRLRGLRRDAGAARECRRAFRSGGGVRQEEYGVAWWSGMERLTNGWFENLLLPVWIPSMPNVERRLHAGCEYADVGCGSGRALVKLAHAFPRSRFVGYDAFPLQVERARTRLRDEGLSDRVGVEVADASEDLPQRYDVISTFDVIHDAVICSASCVASGDRWPQTDSTLPRHQLRGPARGQLGTRRLDALRRQPLLLHDHVPGERGRRARHLVGSRRRRPASGAWRLGSPTCDACRSRTRSTTCTEVAA